MVFPPHFLFWRPEVSIVEFTVKDLITLVQTVGFPIFICIWFLIRTEKVLQAAVDAVNRLALIEEREIEVMRIIMLRANLSAAESRNKINRDKSKWLMTSLSRWVKGCLLGQLSSQVRRRRHCTAVSASPATDDLRA